MDLDSIYRQQKNFSITYVVLFLQFSVLFRYKGTFDAFQSILRESGIRGLWKGWVPNCQRAAIVCLGGVFVCVHVYVMLSCCYCILESKEL